MKPYVICHTLSSIDGRIQGSRWPLKNTGKLFEGPAEKIKVDAWIVGRTTMQEFASKKSHRLSKGRIAISKTDFVGEHKNKTYAVGIDPSGKCRWDQNTTTTEHVIEVLTERVPGNVLQHYRDKQVSYIFAGKTEVNLELALKKLNKLFGIKKVRIDGGGKVNGGFLKAGLIDEISHIVAPVADGTNEVPTVFDVENGHSRRVAKKLTLKSVKKLPGGVLWIRYRVHN